MSEPVSIRIIELRGPAEEIIPLAERPLGHTRSEAIWTAAEAEEFAGAPARQLEGDEPPSPEEASTCEHHWDIERQDGPTSKGKCRKCGEEKDFHNSVDPKDALARVRGPNSMGTDRPPPRGSTNFCRKCGNGYWSKEHKEGCAHPRRSPVSGGNGASLKVKAYHIRYLDGSDETVEADSITWGITVAHFVKGANIVRHVAIQNLLSVQPLTETDSP